MNKLERLFRLLALFKSGQEIPMSKITTANPASARSAYRDIGTLENLGYVIKTDNGYTLATATPRPLSSQFSDLEVRLIRFALETHQLRKVFPFTELASRLENSTTQYSHRLKFKNKSESTLRRKVIEN